MDTKVKVKKEVPSEFASQNESNSFAKELAVMKNNDSNEWCDDREIGMKAEIKQAPVTGWFSQTERQVFIKDLVKKIKVETYTSNDLENDTKTSEESLASDVYLQKRKQFLPEDLINKEYNSDGKIEIDDSCWPKRAAEAPSYCEEIMDGRNADEILRLSSKLVPEESALNFDLLVKKDLNAKQNSSKINETGKYSSDHGETFIIAESLFPVHSVQHTDGNIHSAASNQHNNSDECDINEKKSAVNLHKSQVCEKAYTTKSRFKQHILRHTGVEPHKCEICEQSFTKMSSLKRHVLIHNTVKPHKCEICGKAFTRVSNLTQHILIHKGVKPHKCEICGKSFTQMSHLKQHGLIHKEVNPQKCEICGITITVMSHLKSHMRCHNEENPHKCKICGKIFTRVSHLQLHILMHKGVKPHKCEICGKAFSQLPNLNQHILIHKGIKPHKCEICQKSFTQKSHLTQHILIHKEVKPQKCEICGITITVMSHLKSHILSHKKVKPHKCKICEKTFTKVSHFKQHALIHKGV